MASYQSNLQKVTLNLNKKLRDVGDTSALERTIAASLAASNQRRIHNNGEKVNGSPIQASVKSPKQGAYTKSYAKRRTSKGRQIQKIDLSFTGDLQKSFQPSFDGRWVVGFTPARRNKPPSNAELFDLLTERYGEIWGISRADDLAIEKLLQAYVKRKL